MVVRYAMIGDLYKGWGRVLSHEGDLQVRESSHSRRSVLGPALYSAQPSLV